MGKFWLKIEGLIPNSLSKKFQRKLSFGGEQVGIRKKVGFIFGFPFFVGIATILIQYSFFKINDLLLLFSSFFLSVIGVFIFLLLLIDYYSMSRANTIEKNLPDALELIATNIKSGSTIENALVDSARPEFKELAVLFKRAAKEMFSGSSLEEALISLSSKIESTVLERTIWLVTEGMRKGGELGTIILRIATDLRNESAIKKEINANVSMYLALILIASALGSPLLFGASTVVSDMLTSQTKNLNIDLENASIPMMGGLFNSSGGDESAVTVETLQLFSIISILITSLFASFLVGIIKYNKETAGIRYFPMIAIVAITVYIVIVQVIGSFISGGVF